MSDFDVRPMGAGEWETVAELIYDSTNAWYEANGRPRIFHGPKTDALVFCRVYEDLDPGCCVLAVERASGAIAGSCFYHPRPTHVALGIMNVDPAFFGRGVARRLLGHITGYADLHNLPTRLVSSAANLDSFSLYNRAGFVPRQLFQDMTLTVPKDGLAHTPPDGYANVRPGQPEDAAAMARLEKELVGIDRKKDFEYFLANKDGTWTTFVYAHSDGSLGGFLVSVADPGCNMLGPGVMRDQRMAAALIWEQLDKQPGRSPVWLVPSQAAALVETMYAWGARNCELHVAQVRGTAPMVNGLIMPTFLPETG